MGNIIHVTEYADSGVPIKSKRITDDGFEGTDGNGLPEADLDLSCKDGVTNPDVVVDVKQSDNWVRIPVTGVEQWVSKDGPAAINRNAKVSFPLEWGGTSIVQFINGFRSQNNTISQDEPYDECRIFFYDEGFNTWVIQHYGFVGGIGAAADEGEGKFWVYDPADLMKGIRVSKSWNEPSLSSAINFALHGVDDNGNDVGLRKRSVFEGRDFGGLLGERIPFKIMGQDDVPKKKREDIRGTFSDTFEEGAFDFEIDPPGDVIDSFEIDLTSVFETVIDELEDTFEDIIGDGQKQFDINRHNMVDHLDWIASLIDARWWFEPAKDTPVLVFDATAFKSGEEKDSYERRYFVSEIALDEWSVIQEDHLWRTLKQNANQRGGDEITEEDIKELRESTTDAIEGPRLSDKYTPLDIGAIPWLPNDYLPPHNYQVYATVDVLNNNALSDIKPVNTQVLYGESMTYRNRIGAEALGTAESTGEDYREGAAPGLYTEEYPRVKLTYEPLIQRAGGFEYEAAPIESDAIYIESAIQETKQEFRKQIEESTEGTMELRGEPHIVPYDYLVALPMCNDTYQNVDAEPIVWEVNGVKHKRAGGEHYTTELNVSISIEERFMETEATYERA